MNKLGIIIDNIGKSDLNLHLFSSLHQLHSKNCYANVDIMYKNMSPPFMAIPYSVSHFSEAWSYEGALLATSMSTALNMNSVAFSGKKLLYIWELDWIEQQINYEIIESVYQNKDITLICRSDYHAEIIDNIFNRKTKVIPNFDVTKILEIE